MLKAVIFDMDGVIIDSEPMHAKAAVLALKKYDIDISVDYVNRFIGSTLADMCSSMVEDFNMTVSPKELIKANNDMRQLLLKSEAYPAIPHVISLIRDLHEHGLKLIIASSSSSASIEYVMSRLKINDYFCGYISGDMISRSKPAPDIFLLAAEHLAVAPSECIVIEDSDKGVMAAKAAGMACIGYSNPHSGSQELFKADYIVEGFEEVDFAFISQVYSRIYNEPAIILTTERLVVRELAETDAEALYLLHNEPEIKKYLIDAPLSTDEEKDRLKAYIKNVYGYYGFGLWGVFLREGGRLIGQCGIEYKMLDDRAIYELGYLLSKDYQGKGYALEFASAVAAYCFDRLGIEKITAVIEKDNHRSVNLAWRLGMKKVSECIRSNKECHVFELDSFDLN